MDEREFRNPEYLKRHYAGQALSGLLAEGRLDGWLTPENTISEGGAEKLATLVFDIADAMASEAMKR